MPEYTKPVIFLLIKNENTGFRTGNHTFAMRIMASPRSRFHCRKKFEQTKCTTFFFEDQWPRKLEGKSKRVLIFYVQFVNINQHH